MNSTELDAGWSGVPDLFEIQLTETQQRLTDGNSTDASLNATLALGEHRKDFSFPPDNVVHFATGNRVVVRPEEALIVVFVLILWMGAIGLFVHRWGKIRNCEPYAPKFEAELHRGSCHDQANLINKRMSMSSKLVTQGTTLSMTANQQSFTQGLVSPSDHSLQFKTQNALQLPAYPIYTRSRQNSVFVSPLHLTPPQPPRKSRSAMDLHSMLDERDCEIV